LFADFKLTEVEADLGLSKNIVCPALNRLVAEKKLTKLKLPPHNTYGYSIAMQAAAVLAVEVECDEDRVFMEGLKLLNAAEVQPMLDSR